MWLHWPGPEVYVDGPGWPCLLLSEPWDPGRLTAPLGPHSSCGPSCPRASCALPALPHPRPAASLLPAPALEPPSSLWRGFQGRWRDPTGGDCPSHPNAVRLGVAGRPARALGTTEQLEATPGWKGFQSVAEIPGPWHLPSSLGELAAVTGRGCAFPPAKRPSASQSTWPAFPGFQLQQLI